MAPARHGKTACPSSGEPLCEPTTERWPSGRRHAPAKGAYLKRVSWVRIPSSPPLLPLCDMFSAFFADVDYKTHQPTHLRDIHAQGGSKVPCGSKLPRDAAVLSSVCPLAALSKQWLPIHLPHLSQNRHFQATACQRRSASEAWVIVASELPATASQTPASLRTESPGLLLGHTKVATNVHFLGVEVFDALRLAEQIQPHPCRGTKVGSAQKASLIYARFTPEAVTELGICRRLSPVDGA